jgi:gamma-butyrobetaine dioxygenase
MSISVSTWISCEYSVNAERDALICRYFSSPPRFQALHCLRNRVEGGSSYFVDSFKAAYHILRANPDYSPPPIDYEYDNDGHYIHNTHFLMPQTRGELSRLNAAVNWSPPFQGLPRSAMQKRGASGQTDWYRNLDLFQTTLEQPHREWGFTMEEGDLVLFDNRRVLHARRAFRDLTEAEREERGVEIVEGEPSRWLKGCYLDGEVVWDKLATLNGRINGDKDWAF